MNFQIVSPSGLVYNTFNNVVNIDTSDISECASVTETLSVSVSTDSSSAPSASAPSATPSSSLPLFQNFIFPVLTVQQVALFKQMMCL